MVSINMSLKGAMKFFIFFICFTWASLYSIDIQRLSLPAPEGMERADLYYVKPKHINAILVLSPGVNGNGKSYLESSLWVTFALKHNLGLIGISFASSRMANSTRQGYYYPHAGSGKLLLQGIRSIFGPRKYPLLLYGFSGGAHFTARFAEWCPERVLVWCAYSAMWWDNPSKNKFIPPGIIVCGENDPRLGASLIYFKQGRVLNKPWTWLSVPHNGHSQNLQAENFIRDYFASILKSHISSKDIIASGIIVDIDRKVQINHDFFRTSPTLTAWLPDIHIFDKWRKFYD